MSSLGTGILLVVFPLLALTFTRNSVAVSAVVVLGQAPAILFGLPLGTMADRGNRRQLLVGINVLRFVVLATFGIAVLTQNYGLPTIYVAVFILGALNIGFDIGANASLPSLVHDSVLVKANAHMLNIELTSEGLLGQALGGVAVGIAPALPFLAGAGAIAASTPLLSKSIPDVQPARSERSAWRDLKEGLSWAIGHAGMRLQILIMGGIVLAQGMAIGILALYARESLGLSNAGYGLLLAVGSIGVVFGSLVAARLGDRSGSGMAIVAATVVMAAAYPILAVTHSAVLAATALVLESAGVTLASTASRSIRHRIVPSALQGRVGSAGSTIVMSCAPLGALIGGLIANKASLSVTFLCASAVDVLLVILAGPRIHKAAMDGRALRDERLQVSTGASSK